MKIIVTGGAGFIGSNFIKNYLNEHNNTIVNLDKLTYAGNLYNLKEIEQDPNYIFIKGDICNSQLINDIMNKHKPVSIINFAAESHVDRSIHGPKDFIDTNIIGTYNLLESAKNYWSQLNNELKSQFRFLHISTDEVYGSLSKTDPLFTEESRYEPNSPYSASKAASDHLIRAYYKTYGFPVLLTSCSNNYGPYQFPEKLIPLIIHNALNGKHLPIYGDGLQIRDWLYVDDHCTAINKVLKYGNVGEVYNIGGLNEKTNIEIVNLLCNILDELKPRSDGNSYKNQITYVKDRAGHDRRYAINANKIKEKLGWLPKETFDSGIRKTILWYLNNQHWVNNVTSGEYLKWIDQHYK